MADSGSEGGKFKRLSTLSLLYFVQVCDKILNILRTNIEEGGSGSENSNKFVG